MQQEAISFAAVRAASAPHRPDDAVRSRILVAARGLLQRREGDNLDLRDVATLSGVPVAAIRAHYADCEAVFRASRLALLEEVVAALPAIPSANGGFDAMVSWYLRSARKIVDGVAHRELALSVGRDGARHPWLPAAYAESIERPLAIGIEHLLLIGVFRGLLNIADPARRARDLLALLLSPSDDAAGGDAPGALIEEFYKPSGASRARTERESAKTPPAAHGRRAMIRRGALTLFLDPTEIRWNDRGIALSPIEARIVAALIARGRATSDEIEALIAEEGARTRPRDVFLHRIRRKFAQAGAPDPIETVKGWGLKLRDPGETRRLVIGESATPPALA